jgi:DNA-directed RNA polymerase specialized sigma24 family protein
VCDVERCLRQLEPLEQRLLAFCVLEDRSEWEAARQFHRSQGEVSKRLGRTLDLLHETFCRTGLLRRVEDQDRGFEEAP